MTIADVLWWISVASILVIIPATTMFAIFYAARSDWRRSAAGRSVMYLIIAVDVVLLISLARLLWPDMQDALRWARAIVYPILAGAFWRLFIVLVREQREDQALNGGKGGSRADS